MLFAVHRALFGGPLFWMLFITMHSSNTGPSLLFPPCSSRGFTTGADVRKCGCFCGFLTGSEELQIVQKVVGQFIFPDVEQRKTPLKCWFLAKESCTFSLAFQIKNKEQAKKNLKNKIRYHQHKIILLSLQRKQTTHTPHIHTLSIMPAALISLFVQYVLAMLYSNNLRTFCGIFDGRTF